MLGLSNQMFRFQKLTSKNVSTKLLKRTLVYGSAQQIVQENGVDINKKHAYPGAWNNENLDLERVKYTFSAKAQKEIVAFVNEMKIYREKKMFEVDAVYVDKAKFPTATKELRMVEKRNLLDNEGFALIQPIEGLNTSFEIRLGAFIQTNLMGTPLVQNAEGSKAIKVYDRDSSKKMKDGQRYHQSREGGSMHTDNVNIPKVWQYMFLTCVQPAFIGGDSLLCSLKEIHNYLLDKDPKVLETLRQDFHWEYRGFSDGFFKGPILFYDNKGQPMLRYLRDYLESAYVRKGVQLSQEQLYALDVLDCVCQTNPIQVRYNLKKGESLLANDTHILHGRTAFIDSGESQVEYDEDTSQNRLYQRTWLKV